MDFDSLFTAYYNLFRSDSDVPVVGDDEYTVGMRMANEAINRWQNYDNTYWNELFTTLQNDGGGGQTIVTGQTAYLCPTNFKEAGGFVKIKDSNGNEQERYPIIEPQEAQFKGEKENYCYFTQGKVYYSTGTVSQSGTTITGVGTTFTSAMTGMQIKFLTGETATVTYVSPTSLTASVSQTVTSTTYQITTSGYTLNLNPAPTATFNGMDIDYIYYKSPTLFTTGTTKTEMSDPYFVVHRMLYNQFRAARNPYLSTAKADAENALRQMQLVNNSGTWSSPPVMADNSGSTFGV